MALKWFKKNKENQDEAESPEKERNQSDPISGEDLPVNEIEQEAETPFADTNEPTAIEPDDDAPTAADTSEAPAQAKQGFFKRLKSGLSKTREILTTDIDDLFTGRRKIDDDLLEELEELLITADIGVRTASDLIDHIAAKGSKITTADHLKDVLKNEIRSYLGEQLESQPAELSKPHIIMVVGVNGVGKTTTIGKLAARLTSSGKQVLIAAADTFRAAAIEQLSIWAERAGADIVKHKDHSDPAAVAFDSIEAALARSSDVVLVDTAGRLHTKVNLMEELKKIQRTLAKKLPNAPHEILLVLDATTGQNAISQAELFNEALGITGIALTKLDGTAKGGIVVSICNSLKIPLRYVGVGEQIDDLQDFDPEAYVDALF